MLDFLFNRGEFEERAGTLGLRTVACSAKFPIIPVLGEGLRSLAMLGRERDPEPDPLDVDEDDGEPRYTVAPTGPRAIHLAGMAELWLMDSPRGELRWGDEGACEATLALVDGWASTVLHRLAERPLTLNELDVAIPDLDEDEIESCVKGMDRNGQVESRPGRRGDVYAVTDWGRGGIASLIAAARLEHVAGEGSPIEAIDVQAAFALCLPLVRLPGGLAGACALTVDLGDLDHPYPCGGTVEFERGRLAGWSPEHAEAPDARLSGGVDSWFRSVIEGRLDRLAVEGDVHLAGAILEGLHESMFAVEE